MPPDRPLPRVRALDAFPVRERGDDRFALRDPEGLYDGVLVVTSAVLFLLRHFDGVTTAREAALAWERETGEALPTEEVEALARQLADALVLEGPAVERAREEALAAYRAGAARPPACAGGSYPEDPAAWAAGR